ncbi:hypothetical protein CKO_00744 [Citrobacter koseri ATCC BAA-895]|uniref:Uncharacterized protein n=1 Tax=Citrobacter koseri (strain ATCC BAA-895 / CDC 4225-83 / SGSC4696) TaxID=290338 RepID=A8AEI3_CITK8|nr:hypothetical protein CKO_00744 [Citrobacter koseri ATCC BAA-895]
MWKQSISGCRSGGGSFATIPGESYSYLRLWLLQSADKRRTITSNAIM